ncbi:hypothetical protein GP486_000302 [Trichoglossum hirsutum]|uniref:Uncharacterized protein n=1 Tax=Trichoglossum hirsutum TaxID=265104 RepID=A0A9P8LIT4_9PEZI|nr:hypothetical protein GP486_000302 [Trichoglossum hirsutum]
MPNQLLRPSREVKRPFQSRYNRLTASIKGTLGFKSKDISLSDGDATRQPKPKLLSGVAVVTPKRNSRQESETPSEQLHAAAAGLQEPKGENQSTSAISGTDDSVIANKGNRVETDEGNKPFRDDVKPSNPVPKVTGSDKPFKFASHPRNFKYGSNYVTNVIAIDVDGTERLKRATLDIGAEVSMVASDVVQDLGIKIRNRSESEAAIQLMFPKEGLIEPLGQAEVEWFFQNERRTYKSAFWVLDTERFDILIGRPLIEEHGLLKRRICAWIW